MAKKIADIKVESHSKKHLDTPLPAYFLSLTVENVRCFGPKQTLDLSNGKGRPAQWTIILGNNGVGKTTLLQSIAALTPSELVHSKHLLPSCFLHAQQINKWSPFRADTDSP